MASFHYNRCWNNTPCYFDLNSIHSTYIHKRNIQVVSIHRIAFIFINVIIYNLSPKRLGIAGPNTVPKQFGLNSEEKHWFFFALMPSKT